MSAVRSKPWYRRPLKLTPLRLALCLLSWVPFVGTVALLATIAFTDVARQDIVPAVCTITAVTSDRHEAMTRHGHFVTVLSVLYNICTRSYCAQNREWTVVLDVPNHTEADFLTARDYYVGRHDACYQKGNDVAWSRHSIWDVYMVMTCIGLGVPMLAVSMALMSMVFFPPAREHTPDEV